MNQWRFIDTKKGSPEWNMAVDEALLQCHGEEDLPILRVYGWENSLSFGRFSNLSETLDLRRTEEISLPYVRRMSGGGVLVHGGDLSYSLIVPRQTLMGSGVKENYRYWCRFLIALYEEMGLKARFASEKGEEVVNHDVCLAGKEIYDLVIEEAKMGGNAQRHTRRLFLQHGSIPIRIDTALFEPLFTCESGLNSAASLERLGKFMEYETLAENVRESFARTYGVQLVEDALRSDEEERANELIHRKYGRRSWNIDGQL